MSEAPEPQNLTAKLQPATSAAGADANQTASDNQPKEGLLSDFVHSLAYSALQSPVDGVVQLVDAVSGSFGHDLNLLPKVQFISAPEQAKFGTAAWHVEQVGSALGMAVDFLALGKGIKGLGSMVGDGALASNAGLLGTRTGLGMSIAEAGVTGFTYSALFQPVSSTQGNFWAARATNGVMGAGTFMLMSGASLGLSKLAGSSALEGSALGSALRNPIASGVLSSVPAGAFTAEAGSLLNNHKLASGTEIGQSMYTMAIMGGVFGATGWLGAQKDGTSQTNWQYLKGKAQDGLSSLTAGGDSQSAPQLGLSLATDGGGHGGEVGGHSYGLSGVDLGAVLREGGPGESASAHTTMDSNGAPLGSDPTESDPAASKPTIVDTNSPEAEPAAESTPLQAEEPAAADSTTAVPGSKRVMTVPEGREEDGAEVAGKLLKAARPTATAADQNAFFEAVRDGGDGLDSNLTDLTGQMKNGARARDLIASAYSQPSVAPDLEPAYRQGAQILTEPEVDPAKLQEFAQGAGADLEPQVTQLAAQLGLAPETRLAIRQAYHGEETWVPVDGSDTLSVPVKPELEDSYRVGAEMLKEASNPSNPYWYFDAMRKFVQSPDGSQLTEPLDMYAQLKDDPRVPAFLREINYGTNDVIHSGKPATIIVQPALDQPGLTDDQVAQRTSDFKDFLSLTDDLQGSSEANLSESRGALMKWLQEHPELDDAAKLYGQQSAHSRTVGALDSYFGTDNLSSFPAVVGEGAADSALPATETGDKQLDLFDSQAKDESAPAAESDPSGPKPLTPEIEALRDKPSEELFSELAGPASDEAVMWGGQKPILEVPQSGKWSGKDAVVNVPTATKITIGPGGQSVIADFASNPTGITSVRDEINGTRTFGFEDGHQTVNYPNGAVATVAKNGSYVIEFPNGNYLADYAHDPVASDSGASEPAPTSTAATDAAASNVVANDPAGQDAAATDAQARNAVADPPAAHDGATDKDSAPQKGAQPAQISRVVVKDGVTTVIYSDDTFEQTGNSDAAASPQNPAAQSASVEQWADQLSKGSWNDQIRSAIMLKGHLGELSPDQFKQWLDFAYAQDPNDATQLNLDHLYLPFIQVLNNPEVTSALAGAPGDSIVAPSGDASPEDKAAASLERLQNLMTVRPHGTDGALKFPDWLSQYAQLNGATAEDPQLPTWLLNDARLRFALPGAQDGTLDPSVPDAIEQYLQENPDEGTPNPKKPGQVRKFSLPTETLSTRLQTLDNLLQLDQYQSEHPGEPQLSKESLSKLVELSGQDARPVSDVLYKLQPENRQRGDYINLLNSTLPNATDPYTVKLMLDGIRFGGRAPRDGEDPSSQEQTQAIALAAGKQLADPNTTARASVADAISKLFSGGDKGGKAGNDGGSRGSGDRGGSRGGNQGRNRGSAASDSEAGQSSPLPQTTPFPDPSATGGEGDPTFTPTPLPTDNPVLDAAEHNPNSENPPALPPIEETWSQGGISSATPPPADDASGSAMQNWETEVGEINATPMVGEESVHPQALVGPEAVVEGEPEEAAGESGAAGGGSGAAPHTVSANVLSTDTVPVVSIAPLTEKIGGLDELAADTGEGAGAKVTVAATPEPANTDTVAVPPVADDKSAVVVTQDPQPDPTEATLQDRIAEQGLVFDDQANGGSRGSQRVDLGDDLEDEDDGRPRRKNRGAKPQGRKPRGGANSHRWNEDFDGD